MRKVLDQLVFILAIGCAVSAWAQETAKKNQKTVDVAFYEGGYLYSGGKGIDVDVVNEIKSRGGYNFNYLEQPRVRIWKELEAGTLPMSVSGIQNPARDKFAYFVPYIAQKNKALVVGTKHTTPESLIADKSTKIAVVRGFKHGEFFDQIVERIRANGGVIEVPTIHNLFLMLDAGDRVDMIISQPTFFKEMRDLGIESKVSVYDWDSASKPILLGLILSKAHFSEEDVRNMKIIVEAMRKDGTLKKIFSKYLPKKDVEEALHF